MEEAVLRREIFARGCAKGFRCALAAVGFLMVTVSAQAQDGYVVPISANSPHVFMGITAERDQDDSNFFSIPNSPPQQDFLPEDGSSHFEVAVFDTGSPATIISHDSFQAFGIGSAGRAGQNATPLGGAGGETVNAINSDPVGVYVIGLDGLITREQGGEIQSIVNTNQMRGTINDSVLYGENGTSIPNLIGTTTSSHYSTRIEYSAPKIVEYEGETYRSPGLQMSDLGDFGVRPSRRIQMNLKNGALGLPAFLPDLAGIANNLNDLSDNPSTPTIAGSFWLTLDVTNNGQSRNRLEAIFDTGAQGSIVSEQVAAEMGFDVERDAPDFLVRLAGVTGESEEVKGFYADEIVIPGTDGGLVLNDVPLIVFNLQDPSSESGNTLDALIGMNFFANRDLLLNPEPGNSFLGVSDPTIVRHGWLPKSAEARFSDFRNWSAPGIPAIDWFADMRNETETPYTANVEEDATVGSFVIGGNPTNSAGTSTTVVKPGKTLTLFGNAILEEGGTIHLEDGTLSPLAVEVRGGALSGSGVIEGEVLSQGELIPGGHGKIGTLNFPGSLDQLSRGTLHVEFGDNSDKDNIQHDRVVVEGAISVNGRLSLGTTDDYVQPGPGERDEFVIITAENGILEAFESLEFNGRELEQKYRLTSDQAAFRDHVDDGQFISLLYPFGRTSVVVENYQAIPGDTDGNGIVEFEDFIILSTNFGTMQEWTGGDFDGNGLVDFGDFLGLSTNFDGVNVGAQPVPEPNSGLLASFGMLLLLGVRKRRC